MLPIPGGECYDPAYEPCCTGYYDRAQSLLTAIAEPLNGCVASLDCADPLRTFVTVGRPESAVSDYLAVWIDLVSPPAMPPDSRRFLPAMKRMDFGVKLVERGWPMASTDGTEILEWSDSEVAYAAAHSYGHLQIMVDAAGKWMRDLKCDRTGMQRILPLKPSGGSAGWEMSLFIEGIV